MLRIKNIILPNTSDILYMMYVSEVSMLYIYLKGVISPLVIQEVSLEEYDNLTKYKGGE